MPTRPVESTHEAEPNRPVPTPDSPAVESPSADRMQGANGLMHDEPDPSAAGPRQSTPADRSNEDDASSGDQDIDTAGTAHDDLSPTKSM
jgi:hypothetical protein